MVNTILVGARVPACSDTFRQKMQYLTDEDSVIFY